MSERVTNHYFDTLSGQLLTGDLALEAHIEAGGNPTDVRPLQDVLRDTTNPIPPGTYGTPDTGRWKEEGSIEEWGRWISDLPRNPQEARLSRFMIIQASRMGIGPGIEQIKYRFGGKLLNFYNALGLDNVRRRSAYSGWNTDDEAEYVVRLQRSGQYPTLIDAIDTEAKKGRGPSRNILKAKHGAVSSLLEMKGYITQDVSKKYGPDELVEWGVRFMLDNDGEEPETHALNYLSPRNLAPSYTPIARHFGTLTDYRAAVREAYELELARQHDERQAKREAFKEDIESGDVPVELFSVVESEEEAYKIRAQFLVAKQLLPLAEPKQLAAIATTVRPERFIKLIRDISWHVSPGDIETTALSMHVYDDIWPVPDTRPKLTIPDLQLYKETQRRNRLLKRDGKLPDN